MTEFLSRLVVDHGLAAVLGVTSIAIMLWVARIVFENLKGQNESQVRIERDLARLLERNGMDSIPPPTTTEPKRKILPRAPTPLPFWPVPQPPETKE